jgi:tetratricopeptide (TPR) repeat protein
VLRLHAQLLGWNGEHAASLEAYEKYLALRPDDLEARREQARVAGWGQQFARARRLYADIDQRSPSGSAAHAEAEAKRLFYASRWRDAGRAYEQWLTVEPLNEEAAFEYAETLVAQGRLAEARHVYDRLSRQPRPHLMADQARRTLEERANPSGALNGLYVSSSGYSGQRLLEWSEATGIVSLPVLGDARRKFELSGSSLIYSNHMFRLPAYAGKAMAMTSHSWGSLQGSFSLTRGERDLANWQGHVEAGLALRHNLDLRAGVIRTALLENISSVRDGLASWGPSLSLVITQPDIDVAVSARAGWVGRNLEKTGSLLIRQRVHRGTSELRVVGGVNHSAWRESDLRYFSPEAFTRVDAGAEWTRWLRVPKFRVDRRSFLTVQYLIGADSRGALYHQPRARFSVEHRRTAVDTEASWITSPVYRSLTLRLGVRVGG